MPPGRTPAELRPDPAAGRHALRLAASASRPFLGWSASRPTARQVGQTERAAGNLDQTGRIDTMIGSSGGQVRRPDPTRLYRCWRRGRDGWRARLGSSGRRISRSTHHPSKHGPAFGAQEAPRATCPNHARIGSFHPQRQPGGTVMAATSTIRYAKTEVSSRSTPAARLRFRRG